MKRKQEHSEGWGGPPKSKRPVPLPPKTKYAFKILCPNKLTTAVLGSRGSTKDWIQSQTGTKLVFSNKGEYFPDTHYRTLGVYSDDPSNIPKALDRILKKIVECGMEERKRPTGPTLEFTGELSGEYLFRLCLSDKSSRVIIGPAGKNIQKLRNSSGAKIYVENQSQLGNQMVRVIGRPAVIMDCLKKVNKVVQQEIGTEEYQRWAQCVNFGEPEPGVTRGTVWEHAGEEEAAEDTKEPLRSAAHSLAVDERMDRLAEAVANLPPGAALLNYSIACSVPADRLDTVSELVPDIEKATGAAVDIDPAPEDQQEAPAERLISVVGPLLNIYAAHVMLMRRSKELEQRELQEERGQGQQEEQWPTESADGDEHDRGGEELPEARSSEAEEGAEEWQAEEWPAEELSEGGRVENQQGLEKPSAPSKTELKSQIDMLQAQLAEVQSRMGLAASGSPAADSGRGSRGKAGRSKGGGGARSSGCKGGGSKGGAGKGGSGKGGGSKGVGGKGGGGKGGGSKSGRNRH